MLCFFSLSVFEGKLAESLVGAIHIPLNFAKGDRPFSNFSASIDDAIIGVFPALVIQAALGLSFVAKIASLVGGLLYPIHGGNGVGPKFFNGLAIARPFEII